MTTDVSPSAKGPIARPATQVRLEYLDGLRGVSALYVVLGHIYIALVYFSDEIHLPRMMVAIMKLFNIGQTAVDIFIVVSGYCLMIPVIRSGGALKGGFIDYVRRRAKRILPPYYAALVLALPLKLFMMRAGMALPYEDPISALIPHLLLVHNWSPAWIHEIDPPMWSVAVEWQIYFVFPALLLPLWRAWGALASMLVGVAAGLALHFLPHGALDHTFPWYIGLFAIGNLAATVNFSERIAVRWWHERVPWGWLSLAIWLPTVGFFALTPGWYKAHQWQGDHLIGAAAGCLLIFCTRAAQRAHGDDPIVLRLLQSRIAVALGAMSYSVYLIHYPLMLFFFKVMMLVRLGDFTRAALMYAVCFPLVMAAAYAFYTRFERPFLRQRAAPSAAA